MTSSISTCELWMEQCLLNTQAIAFVSQALFALKSHVKACCYPRHRDPGRELGLRLLQVKPRWGSVPSYAMHRRKGTSCPKENLGGRAFQVLQLASVAFRAGQWDAKAESE